MSKGSWGIELFTVTRVCGDQPSPWWTARVRKWNISKGYMIKRPGSVLGSPRGSLREERPHGFLGAIRLSPRGVPRGSPGVLGAQGPFNGV